VSDSGGQHLWSGLGCGFEFRKGSSVRVRVKDRVQPIHKSEWVSDQERINKKDENVWRSD